MVCLAFVKVDGSLQNHSAPRRRDVRPMQAALPFAYARSKRLIDFQGIFCVVYRVSNLTTRIRLLSQQITVKQIGRPNRSGDHQVRSNCPKKWMCHFQTIPAGSVLFQPERSCVSSRRSARRGIDRQVCKQHLHRMRPHPEPEYNLAIGSAAMTMKATALPIYEPRLASANPQCMAP
jgi:hypothetical protein